MEKNNNWLRNGNTSSYAMLDGSIISLDSEATRVFRDMIKENYVAENHKRKISYNEKRGIWRTFVGNPRKEVTRKTKEALIDYLYKYYMQDSVADSTVMEVFNRRQEYRRNSLNRSAGTIDRDRQAFTRVFDEEFCSYKIKRRNCKTIRRQCISNRKYI